MKRRHLGRFVAATAITVLASVAVPVAWADQPPYRDPGATGTITLCNKDLQPITTGLITDRPTFWRAVGSVAAPSPYNQPGGVASLFLFQPRRGVAPGAWVGNALTAAAPYKNPSAPMAQSSLIDLPLKDILDASPPRWDGWMQLRLLYGYTNTPPSSSYAAANLRITGDRWTLVGGGSSSCGQPGDAVSPEVNLPYYSKSARAVARQQAKQSADASASPQPSRQTPSATESTSPVAGSAGVPTAPGGGGGGGSALPWLVGAALVVLAAVGLGVGAVRLRGSPSGQHR